MRVDPTFEVFVQERSTALLRTAFALTGDRGHAEDMLQVALARTARNWARARAAPDGYVRQALVNLSRDRARSRLRRPPEAPAPPDLDHRHAVAAGDELVADRQVVLQALAQLPAGQRQVIVLRFLEDLSVEQTAQLLGISDGTVKSHTSRALARLRELLAELPASARSEPQASPVARPAELPDTQPVEFGNEDRRAVR
jgi:RNA polymerase sigma-70 factor (sigma-E family)